ncbi:hypothetical protein ACFFTM_13995 [Pseudoduganella plicata]|uniref:Uncharacterized protein n=1 Tax=Pseudoduganella plicata TaxID=321984 RepID=A0A4P7BBK1_9BURK|nr:hypothetical protein [Pseudoduganella plicata]QBQ35520.1 hypothetical protein E1742_04590 [Pseudoduganella plicata]GGY97217.1 hypothetical protein GCM10007388_33620 [Pseudoduganella plicata]
MASSDEKELLRAALSTRFALPDDTLTKVIDQLGSLHLDNVTLADLTPAASTTSKALVAQYDVPPERLAEIIALAGKLHDLKDITIFPQGIVAPRNWRVNIGMRT